MKTFSLTQVSAVLFLLAFSSTTLHALPVDLSIPPSTLGAASDQGYATHWIEMAELDFGQGLSLPVRLGFLSSRSSASVNFGTMPWRAPLINSRIYDRSASSWKLLLPCGRVMTLVPQTDKPDQWGTQDGEWTVSTKDKNTLVSRPDGWQMEFDKDDRLIRLRTDAGRQVVWNRDPNGNVITLVEQPLDPKKPATLGFTVRRDPKSKLITSFTYLTSVGQKVQTLAYDAERRLTKVTFSDSTSQQISYSTTAEGHPSMTVIGRDLISTQITWHKEKSTLLSDGVWSYEIKAQTGNNPIMTRTGPNGEVEIHHDDKIRSQTLFTAANGIQTIRQKVKNGAAKGKLQSITRILPQESVTGLQPVSNPTGAAAKEKESVTGLQPVVPDSAPHTQLLYSAKYDPRSLLTEETDALGHITKHTYVLHGSNIHLGIKTHTRVLQAFQPASGATDNAQPISTTTEEFDRRGNLIASTDALGQTFRFEYDAQNRRLKTIGPDGTVLETLTYTPQSRIATRTDAVGAITRYTYNQDGHRGSITDALGHITTEEHNAQGLLTKTTDPLGRVTTYEYDQGGRLIQQTAAHGTPIAATTLYTYDAQGRRLTATDPAGHTTTQTYDKLGRITSRTDAIGQTTKYEYNVKRGSTGCISCSASGLPTRITSPSGRISERVYDADRHLLEETIASGTPEAATTKYSYDLAGNLLTSTDPLGRTTSHAYDTQNNRIKTTHPDSSTKTFAYNALGQLTAETNELGHATKRAYDAYGNLTAITTPEGHTTKTSFELAPSENHKSSIVNHKSAMAALHRPTAIISPSGEKTTFTYDLLGHKIAVTKGAESKLAATTTHVFDAVGNEIQSTSPTGQVTKHEFDARNRRIRTQDALARAWTFVYDSDSGPSGPAPCCGADPTANSRAAKTIHPDGSTETKVTNAIGQLISTTDAKGDTVEYSYDPDGRLITLTDAKKQITRWRYDTLGKLMAKTYPDKSTELYEHDLAGQMTRRIRPDGSTATYTYNDRSRLLSIVWSDGKTEPSTFAYDAAGHMTLAKNNSATITRAYNESGKLEKEIQEISASQDPNHKSSIVNHKSAVGYEYTPEGRLARLHYPDATTVAYEYNARGELAHVIDTGLEGKPASFDYTRRADGKITQIDLPNGAKTTKTYDAVGRLETIAHLDNNNKILESETSRYDLRNRRTARVHADGSTDLFAYDPAGQVTAAAYGAAQESGTGLQPVSTPPGAATNSPTKNEEPGTKNFTPTQTFAYDPAGNRTSVTDAGMITKYQTNEANQYTRIESSESGKSVDQSVIVEPSFDKLGNLLEDDRNTYTWDADIHLLSVSTKGSTDRGKQSQTTANNSKQPQTASTVSFKYDALHRRVARIESHQTTLFVMDAWNVITEHTVPANLKSQISNLKFPTARHTWGEDLSGSLQGAGGIGGLLASVLQPQHSNSVTCFFHYDSNGNTALLTDAIAIETARYKYDAYGKLTISSGISAKLNEYRFSTKPSELGNGLVYFGFRYYNLISGRWPSKDPIKELGGVNLYEFANNSPTWDYDYLGLTSPTGPFGGLPTNSMTPASGAGSWVARAGVWIWVAKCILTLPDYSLCMDAATKKHADDIKSCSETYQEAIKNLGEDPEGTEAMAAFSAYTACADKAGVDHSAALYICTRNQYAGF